MTEIKEIKVGQVWETKDGIFAVTFHKSLDYNVFPWCVLYNTGQTSSINDGFVKYGVCKLLATYPTFQEAIASKEFNQ